DALGLQWGYEPEGFDLGHGELYLPDFWLPIQRHVVGSETSGHWVEIKPTWPSAQELRRFALLCNHTKHSGYIQVGTPGDGTCVSVHPKSIYSRVGTLDLSKFPGLELIPGVAHVHRRVDRFEYSRWGRRCYYRRSKPETQS